MKEQSKEIKYEEVLELDRNLKPHIISGCKVTSIRLGHRYFKTHIKIAGERAIVNSFKHYILKTVPFKVLYQDEQFTSIFDMMMKLSRYYPKIDLNSPVTVIEFRLEVVDEGSTERPR